MTELSQDPVVRYNQLRDDPWLFLKHCVFTHDEVDQENPVKIYPSHLKYLFFLVQMWLKRKKLAIPKSRRMTVSWTFIGLTVWDCIFHKGRSWAFTSKKEEDAKELVSRAEFIVKNIPTEIIHPDLIPKMKNGGMQTSPPVLEFQFGNITSKIQGFPQGGDQLRQRGFSGILEDECAFQEESEETYAAAEPTIKGGGRMVKVSSRSIKDGGFFKKIVFDRLDSTDTRFPEIPPVTPRSPMEGIDVWDNPRNGFTVVDLHYTANPDKRGDEFREALKRTLPIRQYRMEYEKSWETFDGKPVYEDFNERIHVTFSQPKVQVGLPLLIGWDSSGLTPAVVISQMQEDVLYVVKEIIGIGMGAVRFVPYVASEIKLHFPQITSLEQTISFIDPAGTRKSETNEQTYMQYIIKEGFKNVRPGPVTWEKRKEAVDKRLVGLSRGQAKIQIYEPWCPILVAGFKGGFRYPDSVSNTEPDNVKPVKDIHSHPHDAFQYTCGGLDAYKSQLYNVEIPTPQYGFQKTSDVAPKPRRNYGRIVNG